MIVASDTHNIANRDITHYVTFQGLNSAQNNYLKFLGYNGQPM